MKSKKIQCPYCGYEFEVYFFESEEEKKEEINNPKRHLTKAKCPKCKNFI